jgi:hypothetical protein
VLYGSVFQIKKQICSALLLMESEHAAKDRSGVVFLLRDYRNPDWKLLSLFGHAGY